LAHDGHAPDRRDGHAPDRGANVAETLSAYEQGAVAYVEGSMRPQAQEDYLDSIVALLPDAAHMLELGSGPGEDALSFERRGVRVSRTDGALSFVERLRASGFEAEVLELTTDDFGGPFDVVFAHAVLHHLTDAQFSAVIAKAAGALGPGGVLAFTVKEGDGVEWTTAKVGSPRFFNYWREPALRAELLAGGFDSIGIEHVRHRSKPWLYVLCARAQG
jgi:SAM-dependent methyltransferase